MVLGLKGIALGLKNKVHWTQRKWLKVFLIAQFDLAVFFPINSLYCQR